MAVQGLFFLAGLTTSGTGKGAPSGMTPGTSSRSPILAPAGGSMNSTTERSALEAQSTIPWLSKPTMGRGLRLQTTQMVRPVICSCV